MVGRHKSIPIWGLHTSSAKTEQGITNSRLGRVPFWTMYQQ